MNKHSLFKTIATVFTLAAVVAVSTLTAFAAGKSITIKGSDTMVNLVSNLAEVYMKAHSGVDIAVTGGGSGTGIAALINKTTDICASSRLMKDKEIEQAKAKSVYPKEIAIGLDGLAVMVNPKNSITELTLEQLRKIYTGEYTKWSEVGGADKPIIVLSRESNSGTYVYFQEHVLNKADFGQKVRLMPSTAAIAQSVGEDTWAIGYGGVAYAEHAPVKTVNIKATADGIAVAPTEAAVHDGSYPISRPLFLYTNGEPTGEVQNFIDFCLSDEGQKIVTETGYMTMPKK
jgi:phosphate transport system substrate-binding protein